MSKQKLAAMFMAAVFTLSSALTLFPATVAAEPEGTGPINWSWDLPSELAGNSANPYGGTDYYLDATGGDDDNTGTSPESAWQSLTKASDTTFAPGDRILLKTGEVWENEQLWPKGSGAEGAPITIDAYGDPAAGRPYIAINGNVECPVTYNWGTFSKNKDLVGLTGAIVLRNQEYWEIYNMEISNDDDFDVDISVSGTQRQVVRDGIHISINADMFEDGDDTIMNHFRISNCYIHDIDGVTTWQRIHYGGIMFQVFGQNSYGSYPAGGYYFQDIEIENNYFYKTELHAIQLAFNWFGDSVGQYDDSGKYHEGWEQLWVRTRDLYTRDVYIGHNYCESIGQGAIQLANTQNMLVEYNEINGFLERYNAVSCGLYLWAGADTTMQYNEVYNGPYDEYDGTPWDLEYTNFDVVYQYNYSHDNEAGWMSYMGNSSNSIARYNLSINDNGVIVKNMLSTNYEPTYFVNNVFVYDAARMDYFHDERFKDTVYFLNNVFYNTSTSRSTPWYRYSDALRLAVFENNAYYEAGGSPSSQQPADEWGLDVDPQFVIDDVANYKTGLGVDSITLAAEDFKLKDTSPLIDAGHYVAASGSEDIFGGHLYYGDEIDIGIYEAPIGEKVENPVENIRDGGGEDKVNLALNKPITASATHHSGRHTPEMLVDGDLTTRWACADPPFAWPIEIEIDFEETVLFNEVFLDEFTDHETNLRVENFELQRWDEDAEEWITFESVTGGMGHDLLLEDFGIISTSKLRLLITKQFDTEIWSPSMTEIQVFMTAEVEAGNPSLSHEIALFDQNENMQDEANNVVAVALDLDTEYLSAISYYNTNGSKLRTLAEGDHYTVDGDVYTISNAFLSSLPAGTASLHFEFLSGNELVLWLEIVDTTELEALITQATGLDTGNDAASLALKAVLEEAEAVLALANRVQAAPGNDSVTQAEIASAADDLADAIDTFLFATGVTRDTLGALISAIGETYTDPSLYTIGSWAAFGAAFEEAIAVYTDETATSYAITTAYNVLAAAEKALIKAPDKSALVNAIETAKEDFPEIQRSMYDPAAWDNLQATIAAAEAVVANSEASVADVRNAVLGLSSAVSAMEALYPDRSTLILAIKQGESADLTNATPGSIAALEAALEYGRQTLADDAATQDDIKEAVELIVHAITNLKENANKDELQALYDGALTLNGNSYTPSTWNTLEGAMAQALSVLNNDEASQTQVDNAYNNLLSAIAGLRTVANRASLESLISIAQNMVNNIDDYAPATVAGLPAALESAKAVYYDLDATQAQVNAAANALQAEIVKAREKADKTRLRMAMAQASSLDLSLYTADSGAVLTNLLSGTDEILADENVEQETVDQRAQDILDAITALVANKTTGGSGNGSGSGSGYGSGSGGTDTNTGTGTGNSTNTNTANTTGNITRNNTLRDFNAGGNSTNTANGNATLPSVDLDDDTEDALDDEDPDAQAELPGTQTPVAGGETVIVQQGNNLLVWVLGGVCLLLAAALVTVLIRKRMEGKNG